MQRSINETLQSQPIAAGSMLWTVDYRIIDFLSQIVLPCHQPRSISGMSRRDA